MSARGPGSGDKTLGTRLKFLMSANSDEIVATINKVESYNSPLDHELSRFEI